MRYVPDVGDKFILQVPEDKNSYINVKNSDARGLDTVFRGRIINESGSEISIGEITDGEDGTLQQYLSELSSNIELQAFFYRAAGLSESPIISVVGSTAESIDFSSSTSTAPTLQPLKYYIFGYDVDKGRMPNSVQVIGGNGSQYSKVLDPNLWNVDQYFDIQFTRTGQYVLPVIYRVWGTRIEFLGVIGGGKIGYPGASTISFRDYGLTEIPSWNSDPVNWTPDFMEGCFTVSGGVPTMQKKIVGKEHFKIKPTISGTSVNYLVCQPADGDALKNPSTYLFDEEVKFLIDDTRPIRDAIAVATSTTVKEIFFPTGTYYFRDSAFINSTSTDYSDLTLRGVGAGSVIKRVPSTITSSNNPGLLNFTGQAENPRVSGIRLRSLVFDGNKRSNFSTISPAFGGFSNENLVGLKNADSISITECFFIDSFGSGIYSEDSKGLILTGSTFTRLGRSYEQEIRPLYVKNCENAVVQGNIFEFCTAGPFFSATDFSTINNNIIRSCGDSGIVLETSYQWNATSNLAYSDTDSLIRSVDQYNNEYSKAVIEVLRGTSLEPIYFTVTNGGEAVGILKDTLRADIYALDSIGRKSSTKVGSFRVLQTADQLEAGIFSVTLPGTTSVTVGGNTIPATSSLSLLDPADNKFGYMYEINAMVKLGLGGKGFSPTSIRELNRGGINYLAIELKNSSDLLSFQIYSVGSSENDKIIIDGYSNGDNLSGWDQNQAYTVVDIDIDSNSLLLNTIPTLSPGTDGIQFLGGRLYVVRSNYQIADGNILVN